MLQVASDLGFTVGVEAEDPSVRTVTLRLGP
jgi:hypothetical protein